MAGKPRETRNHSLTFVGSRQCVGYPFAQLIRLHYAVQVKFLPDEIRNLEEFGRLTTSFAVVFHRGRLQNLIIQNLGSATAGFRFPVPELLELKPGGAFTHGIIKKGLAFSAT